MVWPWFNRLRKSTKICSQHINWGQTFFFNLKSYFFKSISKAVFPLKIIISFFAWFTLPGFQQSTREKKISSKNSKKRQNGQRHNNKIINKPSFARMMEGFSWFSRMLSFFWQVKSAVAGKSEEEKLEKIFFHLQSVEAARVNWVGLICTNHQEIWNWSL